ncbi:hypothetical protein [Geminicoccus roseus]|uniref:hypothetical protein n=1 Tax=Geminicoccus roseus TaxID=404900 RepID=UPI0004887475|nr:hypothetical protein [Geminicoccus roseus]
MAKQAKYQIDWSNSTGRIARVEADEVEGARRAASEMIAERKFKYGTTVTVDAPKDEQTELLDYVEAEMAKVRDSS